MNSNATCRAGVAAGHDATAEAARAVLREGGNAFDAVLAGFLAACVAEPVLASLGGGGFLVARPANGAVEVFDFFTDTPLKRPDPAHVDFQPIDVDFGTTVQEFHIGLGAVATPGAVGGIFEVHRALGRMPMATLIEPAMELAKGGVVLNAFQAYLLNIVGPIYAASDASRAQFCRNGSDILLEETDRYRPEDFGGFLDALVREGEDLFYRGDIAARIAAMDGITIGRKDLESYRVRRRKPLASHLAGHDIQLNPPPAIGGVLIDYMLRTLDRNQRASHEAFGAHHAELLAQSMAACNRIRSESRIDFDPSAGAETVRAAIGHPPAYRGTTHISVADEAGNLAALTVSNGEGCGHVVAGTGMMLNNMLGEHDLNAAGFFNWPEGVRLSSMMTPGMIFAPDGACTAFGSGGSNRIRTALTQVIVNLCLYGLSVHDAVAGPRMHIEGDQLSMEPGLDLSAIDWAGETQCWPERNMYFGGAHVIKRDAQGNVAGVGDPRRDGVFLGL